MVSTCWTEIGVRQLSGEAERDVGRAKTHVSEELLLIYATPFDIFVDRGKASVRLLRYCAPHRMCVALSEWSGIPLVSGPLTAQVIA